MKRRGLLAALVISCLALAAPAFAAKGGNSGGGGGHGSNFEATSGITLDQTDPHLGGEVTFNVSYPHTTKHPRIQVMSYQDGVLTYGEAGEIDHAFLLGGGMSEWLMKGGPASCTADLFDLIWNGNNMQEVVWLAVTSFDAAG